MSRSPLNYEPQEETGWRKTLAAEWRYFLAGFSREKVISNLKTFAWVVPMTLLIWIYAEREQVLPAKNVSVPIYPVSDSSRIVTLIRPMDKNIILDLEGPQGKLQHVLQMLQGGPNPGGLKIDIPMTLPADSTQPMESLDLIQKQQIFRDNGITVRDVQPRWMEVRIDTVREVKARVVVPPETNNLQDPVFDPPEVTIRGPKQKLDDQEKKEGRLTVYADLSALGNRAPGGPYQVPDVPIMAPPASLFHGDDRITFLPEKVRATVTIRDADEEWIPEAIPIYLRTNPGDWSKKYNIIYKTSLSSPTIVGPKDIIDAMKNFGPKPTATLTIENDAILKGEKTLTYDLPNGVRVSTETRERKIPFELVLKPVAERLPSE